MDLYDTVWLMPKVETYCIANEKKCIVPAMHIIRDNVPKGAWSLDEHKLYNAITGVDLSGKEIAKLKLNFLNTPHPLKVDGFDTLSATLDLQTFFKLENFQSESDFEDPKTIPARYQRIYDAVSSLINRQFLGDKTSLSINRFYPIQIKFFGCDVARSAFNTDIPTLEVDLVWDDFDNSQITAWKKRFQNILNQYYGRPHTDKPIFGFQVVNASREKDLSLKLNGVKPIIPLRVSGRHRFSAMGWADAIFNTDIEHILDRYQPGPIRIAQPAFGEIQTAIFTLIDFS